jgi:hypothetical protein
LAQDFLLMDDFLPILFCSVLGQDITLRQQLQNLVWNAF